MPAQTVIIWEVDSVKVGPVVGQKWSFTTKGVRGSEVAEVAIDLIRETKASTKSAALLLVDEFAFAARIDVDRQLPRSPQALAFALEEELPVDAENLQAICMDSRLSVASDLSVVEPVVTTLAAQGIGIGLITFKSLAAIECLLVQKRVPRDGLVLLFDRDQASLFEVTNNQPASWHWFSASQADCLAVSLHLSFAQLNHTKLTLINAPDDFDPSSFADHQVSSVTAEPVDQLACQFADQVLPGQRTPLVNLAFGRLAKADVESKSQRAATFLVAATALALLAVCGAMLLRASQNKQLALELDGQVIELYKTTLPDGRDTQLIERTMREELQRLNRRRALEVDLSSSAEILKTIQQFLAAVPNDMNFNLSKIVVTPAALNLEGKVEGLEDFTRLRNSFEAGGFASTDRNSSTSFILPLERASDPKEPGSDK